MSKEPKTVSVAVVKIAVPYAFAIPLRINLPISEPTAFGACSYMLSLDLNRQHIHDLTHPLNLETRKNDDTG